MVEFKKTMHMKWFRETYESLIDEHRLLEKKNNKIHQHFADRNETENHAISQQLRKIMGLKYLIDKIINQKIAFDSLKPNEIDALMNGIATSLKDIDGLFYKIQAEIETITGKKIRIKKARSKAIK